MSRAVPLTAASTSSSEPRAGGGWGATSKTAISTEVMNSTRVCAAQELRLSDAASAPVLTEIATNSRPVSAPAGVRHHTELIGNLTWEANARTSASAAVVAPIEGSGPARPNQARRPLRGLSSQGSLIDAAEQVDRFPRIVNPSINGFDVEIGLIPGGIGSRLIVN